MLCDVTLPFIPSYISLRNVTLARFILEMNHPSWTNMHTNWASNDSSSDNLSVYKYGKQTDHPSRQVIWIIRLYRRGATNYPSVDRLDRYPSVCPYLYTDELLDELSLLAQLVCKFVQDR